MYTSVVTAGGACRRGDVRCARMAACEGQRVQLEQEVMQELFLFILAVSLNDCS